MAGRNCIIPEVFIYTCQPWGSGCSGKGLRDRDKQICPAGNFSCARMSSFYCVKNVNREEILLKRRAGNSGMGVMGLLESALFTGRDFQGGLGVG